MASTGTRGYVACHDYFFLGLGTYRASVTLDATGPVSVEVWNSSTNTLLARNLLDVTKGFEKVDLTIDQTVPGSEAVFDGRGPFRIKPFPLPPGQPIEIRVYNPGGSSISVKSVGTRSSAGYPPGQAPSLDTARARP
jgi:hypothetical protein